MLLGLRFAVIFVAEAGIFNEYYKYIRCIFLLVNYHFWLDFTSLHVLDDLSQHSLFSTDVSIDCGTDSITLTWTTKPNTLNPSSIFLGSCPPTRLSSSAVSDKATFQARLDDCNFMRMVTGNQVIYKNHLTACGNKCLDSDLFHDISCVYERSCEWTPPLYQPLMSTGGHGELSFHMGLMNGGACGPLQFSTFPLGSFIPICATVDQKAHMPLVLFMEECVATSSSKLTPSSQTYQLVSNKGCLVDGLTGYSMFQRVNKTCEIVLYLQAFEFAAGQEVSIKYLPALTSAHKSDLSALLQVYIHCRLVAGEPGISSEDKKACNYNKELQRWELLDNPLLNSLCNCCDTSCTTQKRRDVTLGTSILACPLSASNLFTWNQQGPNGLGISWLVGSSGSNTLVLGPVRVVDPAPKPK
ncbi:zona pellucida sperm-binding protein 3-like [Arapaima gigas]